MPSPERTPELIRQVAERRRARELPKPRDPQEVAQELARTQAEQAEADNMFIEMRDDCVDLLNKRGVIKKHGPFRHKYKAVETWIPDDEGNPVSTLLYSANIEPAKSSEVALAIKGLDRHYLSFRNNHWYIIDRVLRGFRFGVNIEEKERIPDLQDARNWKEVVDAIKNQKRGD